MSLSKLGLSITAFLLLTASTGVDESTQAQTQSISVQPVMLKITVKKGDTLSSIAHATFGRAKAWKILFANNRNIIKNADFIKPGMILTYSQEAAEISKAEVMRAKELKKLAVNKKNPSKTIAKATLKKQEPIRIKKVAKITPHVEKKQVKKVVEKIEEKVAVQSVEPETASVSEKPKTEKNIAKRSIKMKDAIDKVVASEVAPETVLVPPVAPAVAEVVQEPAPQVAPILATAPAAEPTPVVEAPQEPETPKVEPKPVPVAAEKTSKKQYLDQIKLHPVVQAKLEAPTAFEMENSVPSLTITDRNAEKEYVEKKVATKNSAAKRAPSSIPAETTLGGFREMEF